ncbi:hypothetical protein [Massilia sp. TS11]|uniref:hypothetical protein n=1 Tax=Massilia sp. TS11 TaxID=2908003 RepID=UPI001EDAC6D1|nr:hypothetical protein [Massilia sp. TS11]MCG2585702.1 hypothetical protein [Massilia sp. TS11]
MKHLLIGALFASCCALAQGEEVQLKGYKEAVQNYVAATNGDASARDAAADAFGRLAATHPEHPLMLAYQGSAIALQGRDALMPWSKMKFAEQGANMIEKALNLLAPGHDSQTIGGVPESLETRLVAAQTLLALPDFMNRATLGKRALDAALAMPALASAPAAVRQRAYAVAAQQAAREKRSADEVQYWKQVAALGPQTPSGLRAAARLKELGQ